MVSIPTSSTIQSDQYFHKPVLKVIGLGGGGCNAINRMIELGLRGVDFIAANTDRQVLQTSLAPVKVQLGPVLTRGLGAGSRPDIGESAALESAAEIKAALAGADMVFLTAGMGGGTGTGAIPVAAAIAQQIGAITVGIVTTPFSFEMGRRQKNATDGVKKLTPHTDTLIAISNDRLLEVKGGNMTIDLAFRIADDVLRQAVQGVTELITESGLINVDFSHIKRLMKMGGGAFLAIGQGEGDDKAMQAVQNALKHPLLESVSLEHAQGILVNFTGGQDLSFHEVTNAFSYLQDQATAGLDIVMGVVNDDRMSNRAQVILIVTGIGARTLEDVLPGSEKITQARPELAYRPVMENLPQPQVAVPIPVKMPLNSLPISSYSVTEEAVEWKSNSKQTSTIESTSILTSENLDIPAFLRRRRDMRLREQTTAR
ncbi:MAG: cell division protein FtsZ [Chloroflexota bacterium]